MVFYDKYKALCEQKNMSPTAAGIAIGASKATVNRWKNGSMPSGSVLKKVCEYFGVSADYFLDVDGDAPKVAPDVQELIEDYNSRPEMKMLFKATKGVTAEDIERAAKFLEAMKGDK